VLPYFCTATSNAVDIKQSVSVQRHALKLSCCDRNTVNFFPHEVADLSIALNYMLMPDGPVQESSQWALRYVVLLWLSLVCMIPFDLVQFDETDGVGQTATAIESLAKKFLGKAGLEREGAAILLSRLYMRYVAI
jgi:hypothetical protein